jgi:hypothetical protein
MLKKTLFLAATVVVLLSAGTLALAFEFKTVSTPNAQRLLRAHIVIPDPAVPSGVREVGEHYTFFDFEKFRLSIEPKQSGHVYLFSRNSQGEVQLLYPLEHDGDNYVARKERIDLPGNGWLRFDRVAGQEELILLQSPTPLEDIETARTEGTVASEVMDRYEMGVDTPCGLLVRHIFLEHKNR